jgi:membrane-bound lytic murein transglycosylase A
MISTRRSTALSLLSAGLLSCAAACALLMSGCAKVRIPEPPPTAEKDYARPLPAGMPALRKITDPARLPDFRAAFDSDREGLLTALNLSLGWFAKPSSRKFFPVQDISHERAAASLAAFREILTSAHSGDELQARILAGFDVYESVGCDDAGTVLFTGYYTPIFDASLTPTAEYHWPLYQSPPDLVKDPNGECIGRKLPDGTIEKSYYSRQEIDQGAIKGQELVYLKDRFEAFVCTVEGSAQLRLPDGSLFKAGYAANNGRDYKSVGLALVDAGLLPKEQLTLSNLIKFFQQNPGKMDEYLPRNERYVFFQKTDTAPTGSLGVPVTAHCTIATDKSVFPRGCLAFVDTQAPLATGSVEPVKARWRHFALDQDSGGAIRAAGRADIYVGIGDQAGRVAGWMLDEGRLYYLFLKQ